MLNVTNIRTYLGPNVLCDYPAIAGILELDASFRPELLADLASVRSRCIRTLAEFVDGPGPIIPDAPLEAEGEVERAARLVGWLTAYVQNVWRAGVEEFGSVRAGDGAIFVVSALEVEPVAVNAMRFATQMFSNSLAQPGGADTPYQLPGPLRETLSAFVKRGRALHFDKTTRGIVADARKRNIPHYRLSAAARFVQLGQGHRQRHFFESMGDRVSVTGDQMSHDKRVAHHLLERLGIASPPQFQVTSYEGARKAAAQLGYPVVVKPSHGSGADGVSTGLINDEELKTAFESAVAFRMGVILVEKHMPGEEYRLLVIGGRYVGTLKRVRPHVAGNGRDTFEQLIAAHNRNPAHPRQFMPVPLDADCERTLLHQGYTLRDVAPAGRVFCVRSMGAYGRGGASVDVTGAEHPDLRDVAVLISRAFRLDVVGIDYLTTDITKSYRNGGGVVCEVNSRPGLHTHWEAGADRDLILNALFDMHFARGDTARVPVIAVSGPGDKIAAAGMSAAIMTASGLTTALAGPQGVSVGAERFREGPCREEQFVGGALFNPRTEAAVFELSYDGLLRRGIPIDACDVVAITAGPPGEAMRGEAGLSAVHVRIMKAKLAAIASRYVVLDAADNDAATIAGSARVPVCWIAHEASNPIVKAHLASGGLAVAVGGDSADRCVEVRHGTQAPAFLMPLPTFGAQSTQEHAQGVTQLLFAAAIGVVSGVAPEHIREGIGCAIAA